MFMMILLSTGKTALLEALAGVGPGRLGGSAAFQGRDLQGWDAKALGRRVLYLPPPERSAALAATVRDNLLLGRG
jgi:ABC-type branched-subunit amino acid transport system ATPase component